MSNRRPVLHMPDLGKVPPQDIEAEEAVLGACMVYPDVIHDISLSPEMFYLEAHQEIFEAIRDVSMTGSVDLISVQSKLRNKGKLEIAGGPVALTMLLSKIFTDQMTPTHASIVKDKFQLREYIRIGTEIRNMAFTDDVADVKEHAETGLFHLSDITEKQEPVHISKGIDEVLEEVRQVYTKEKSLIGVPSGFLGIDRITGGWQPGNLIIIAARPSMGKTALALILSLNPARRKFPVTFFSLEMSREELITRYLSGSSGYTNIEIRNAYVNFDKLVDSSHELAGLPITIDDTPALNLISLRSKIKKQIMKNGTKLIIIDYLQLMSFESRSREQEVSAISRGLKAISKDFNIPVIALSQLNRNVEDRADKRPRLADLRESGSIEQDADIVCFIYRPAHYKIQTTMIDNNEISTQNLMVIDGAKNRNGALFCHPLYHNPSFTDIREEDFELRNEPH